MTTRGRAIAQLGHKKIGQIEGGLYPANREYNGGVRTHDQVVSSDSFQPAIAAKKDALTGGHGCVALPAQSQRVSSDEGKVGAICATGDSGRNRGGGGVSGLFVAGEHPAQAMRAHSPDGFAPTITATVTRRGRTDGLIIPPKSPGQADRVYGRDNKNAALTDDTGGTNNGCFALWSDPDPSVARRDPADAPNWDDPLDTRRRMNKWIFSSGLLLCRPLCITEMLRLMHLPEDFDFGAASLGAQRSGIGNGFDIAVVAAVIRQVLRI